jgi:Zn-dependent protease with chaperone function
MLCRTHRCAPARKDFKVCFRTSSQVVVGHATLIYPRSGPIRGLFMTHPPLEERIAALQNLPQQSA